MQIRSGRIIRLGIFAVWLIYAIVTGLVIASDKSPVVTFLIIVSITGAIAMFGYDVWTKRQQICVKKRSGFMPDT